MSYRVVEDGQGNFVRRPDSETEPPYTIPLKFSDVEKAKEVVRMLNFRGGDRKFTRGMIKGIVTLNHDTVEYDP